MSTISNITAAYGATSYESKTYVKNKGTEVATSVREESVGVVYEKSEVTSGATSKADRSALIEQLKADTEKRVQQMKDLVTQMMTQQGKAIGQADPDSIWSFLASGDFTVTAEVKAQAQADIAEDGYWGVTQTSDRILEFAKALTGGDPEKAEQMFEAFEKGFRQATGAWGKELPDISQRTYEAVKEKFDAWKNGTEETTEAE